MTQKVIFDKNWESYFSSNGLNVFEDFFELKNGQVINQNSRRNVMKLNLSHDNSTKIFYLKRFFNPHIKDMLFTLSHFGRLTSQAELEWRNANTLLNYGIETYHPVCYGFRSICGIERQSFIVTEEINGRCLLDYLIDSWQILCPKKQEALVIHLGQFFKKIHASKLNLPDSYIWHIYMINKNIEADTYEFGMIDLHRMQSRISSIGAAAMNLGRFLFSLPEGFMDMRLQQVFIDSYLEDNTKIDKKSFVNHVRKWETRLLKRRKKIVNSLASPSKATSMPLTKSGS